MNINFPVLCIMQSQEFTVKSFCNLITIDIPLLVKHVLFCKKV